MSASKAANNISLDGTVIWFTGLSGAGKTTIAVALKNKLEARSQAVYLLDGDQLRAGLNADLGFSDKDRSENIRRAAEVARLFAKEGNCVLATFISPFKTDRKIARQIAGNHRFIEVFVSCPISICEKRDVKGLYKKARAGLITQFTGIDSPYEKPDRPDVIIHSAEQTVEEAINLIWGKLL
ncbi:MAG: adenylyl-sulfate kinase [Cyclobacteriaceae bacterium]|jgi:adenylylsulfate kinase|nr:adenylyl-sulfate kinase [Cyclobacteriaceae bacterium]